MKLLKIKLRLQDRLFQQKPSEMNSHIDGELDRIVLKAVAFDKTHRFATCRDFAQAVEDYLDSRFIGALRTAQLRMAN